MATERKQVDLSRLCAVNGDLIYLGTMPEDWEHGSRFVGICQYDAGKWFVDMFDFDLASLTLYKDPKDHGWILHILSDDGIVVNFHTKQRETLLAPTAPVRKTHALGLLRKIRQIGDTLFACGGGGQVYRRSHYGDWSLVDPGFLDRKGLQDDLNNRFSAGEFKTEEDGKRFRLEWLATQANVLWSLSGLSEDDFYVCSEKGAVFHCDGTRFTSVPVPPPKPDEDGVSAPPGLLDVLVETPERVWVCGRGGTVMLGNRKDGFRSIPFDGVADLNGMTLFKGKLYLSSISGPRGLFSFDGRRFERVRSGVTPDIDDVNAVDAVDDVLWVMGTRDLLRFDGAIWERFDFPGNDPVR